MKGMIFTALADLVERDYGLATWQKALDSCDCTNSGAYSAGGSYPDHEILCLVGFLCEELDLPKEFVLRRFGESLFESLKASHPYFLTPHADTKSFLLSIKDVIHKDVEKLHPGTSLPWLSYASEETPKHLTMLYQSKRKLCFLAEGLILGAANHFECEIALIHSRCVYRGDENCQLDIQFYD